MKIQRLFTIELEVWSNFELKVDRGKYSEVIEELMRAYSDNKEVNIKDEKELKSKYNKAIAKVSELNSKIKDLEKEKEEKAKEVKVFKEWEVDM